MIQHVIHIGNLLVQVLTSKNVNQNIPIKMKFKNKPALSVV